ncbi:hypothetical protein AMJ80_06635 [bacterium SM23_31]|nr:MAG: hypothetical protein AMJ80_06635 [bacterium SM23_31]
MKTLRRREARKKEAIQDIIICSEKYRDGSRFIFVSSLADIAFDYDVSRETLRRYLREEGYKTRLNEIHSEYGNQEILDFEKK